MGTRTPAAILSLSAVTFVTVASEPIAVATDVCTQQPGERACPVEQQPPSHKPDVEPEQGYRERISLEQAPPPVAEAMPPGRGTQWQMFEEADFRAQRDAAFMMAVHRNGAVLAAPATMVS